MDVKQVFPIFEEGRILKKDALDLLRDYAPEYFSLLFKEYGSGVLTGFKIRECEGGILVGPGLMKDDWGLFCMGDAVRLEYHDYGKPVQIVIKRMESSQTLDFRTDCCRLTLEPIRTLGKGEYELGRFCLERGARLRTYGEYKDFYDLNTEFNTLNLIHVMYCCENGSGLLPSILKLYGRGIIKSSQAKPLDISFATACLNGFGISKELMDDYLSASGMCGKEGTDNLEHYHCLEKIYTRLAAGGEVRQRPAGIMGKTVID